MSILYNKKLTYLLTLIHAKIRKGFKFAHMKPETLRYHTVKTQSLYLTWA